MTSVAERRRIFRELHASGCFVIPNPWDVGSARVLAQFGFQALATTSCGFAWSVGCADNHVTLNQALTHLEAMSAAVKRSRGNGRRRPGRAPHNTHPLLDFNRRPS